MKETIVATDRDHLKMLIKAEIALFGPSCDLNHIDVSGVTSMICLFNKSPFNGNISRWDVSGVENMAMMFNRSLFNGDVSQWNTAACIDMTLMFSKSPFNSDISAWNVSCVTDMQGMFSESPFEGNVSDWDVRDVLNMVEMFEKTPFSGDLSRWQFHPQCRIDRMVDAPGLASMRQPCVAHWLAKLTKYAPLPQECMALFERCAPIATALEMDVYQTSFWMQQQWCNPTTALCETFVLPELDLHR